MKKIWLICLLMWFAPLNLFSQAHVTYQKPPKEILDLATAKLPPTVVMNDNRTHMIFLFRDRYKSLATLSEKELRLAGLRINPTTNNASRITFYKDITIAKVGEKKANQDQRVANQSAYSSLQFFSKSKRFRLHEYNNKRC